MSAGEPGGTPRLGQLAVFAAVFLATRLFNLMVLPIFLDEAIHVEWALKMAETGRLLGITDGGRYLPIWIYSLIVPHFADPVFAARVCSVAFGLGAALGLVWLGRVVYSARAGFFAALLYLVLPPTLLYDRMALVDSLLCALVILCLGCAARWAETGSLGWATALGVAIGCAGITKFYGALLAVVPILFIVLWPGRNRKALGAQLQWILLVTLAVMLPVFLDLAATLQFVTENVWVFRKGPQGAASLARGVRAALLWQAGYVTPLGAALIVLAVLHVWRRREAADGILLALWAIWCLFLIATGGRDWFPRYLLPGLVPLLLLTADQALRLADDLATRVGRPALRVAVPWGVVALFALSSLRTDRALLVDPAAAMLPGMDRWQYLEDWPAGSRLRDVAAFLRRTAARHGAIAVLRDQRSGPVLEGLNLMLRRDRGGIEFVDVNIRRGRLPAAVRGLTEAGRPVLLVGEQPPAHPLLLSLDGVSLARPLAFFLKPKGLRQVEVYCVFGACAADEDAALSPASAVSGPFVESTTEASTARDLDGPGALEELRVCALEAGGESLAACRRALAAGLSWPRAAEAHYSMGRNLTTFGRYGDALAAFREAARLLPDDVEQTLALAATLESFAHHEEALAKARNALRFVPEAPAVHQRIGYNLAWLGRLAEAEAALRQALALDAAQAGVHNDLAVVLWLEGKRDEAVAAFREALGIDDEAVRTRYNMGVVEARLAASR